MTDKPLRKTTIDFAVNAIRRLNEAGAKAGNYFDLSNTKRGARLVMKFPSEEDALEFYRALNHIAGAHKLIETEKETV